MVDCLHAVITNSKPARTPELRDGTASFDRAFGAPLIGNKFCFCDSSCRIRAHNEPFGVDAE